MRTFVFLFLGLFLTTSLFAQKRKSNSKKKVVKIDTLRQVDAVNPAIEYIVLKKKEVKIGEGMFLDGQKEGFWRKFHANGRLSNLSEYRKGELVGVSMDFSDKGMMTKQINHQFANDTIVLQDKQNVDLQHYTIYGDVGQLLQTGSKLKGKKMDIWRDFYPDGTAAKMTTYSGDIENGKMYVFDKNGGIEEEMMYEKGLLSGQKLTYNVGGKGKKKMYFVSLEENYKDGKLDGVMTKYKGKDKPQEISNYKNGVKHGTSKWFYDSGELLSDFEYVNGVLVGKSNAYYQNGKVKTIATYQNNKLHDVYQSFHKNGELEAEGKYIEGEKDGKWVYYDKEGKVEKTKWYEKGELKKEK